jgi:oligopeptide transport system substrate-binding protein
VLRNLFLVFVAALMLSGCGQPKAVRAPCPEGKLCLEAGNVNDPVSLDPHKTQGTWENRIIGDLIMGLTQEDQAGNAIPGIATHWETSADGKVWTFHLRRALWSDGVPVTAEDFVYALRRIMDPKTGSSYSSLLYIIQNGQAVNENKMPLTALGVRAIDPLTLEIRLNHAAPFLPEIAKHNSMYPVPKHVVEKWGDDWSRPEHFVGNGPFNLVSWKLGDRVTVVKNPKFYEADTVCLDQINYYPTTDASSAQKRVKSGELDVNTEIQSNKIALLREPGQMPDYVRVHTYLGTTYLAFNGSLPALKDRRVRQALSMAIDREFITEKLLRGGQSPANSFVPPGVANYPNPAKAFWADWSLAKRQAEARKLLAAAGFGPKTPLTITIKHRNSSDPMLFMPAIQADWKEIGVNAKLEQNEGQIAYQSYRLRDFEVADAAWIADYNDPMTFLYLQQSATGTQNYSDYANPAYDGLLAKADNEPDAVKRSAYLSAAEQIMLDDAPIVPIYFYVNKNLVSPRVTGWTDNITDWHRSRYLCFKDGAAKGG